MVLEGAAMVELPTDRPWTLEEAAGYLRESQRTTRRRAARGDLEVIRPPGSRKLLFDPAEVRRFLDDARVVTS